MSAEGISLLGFLRTPVLVGDPDGCIVYANPSFRDRFCGHDDDPVGQPLAMVFGGGAREVVLSATATVLQRGEPARLQLREAGHGYLGLASPIEAEDDRVGVVMVLLEENSNEEHLTGLADEISEPIADGLRVMQQLSSEMGDLLLDAQRDVLDRGMRSLESAQKWLKELQVGLRGGKPQQGRFDVAAALMRVADRCRSDLQEGTPLEILMSPNLPRAAGSNGIFERLLLQLMRQRIDESRQGQPLTLLARVLGGDDAKGILVSVVDMPDANRRESTGHPPEALQQGLAGLGGEAICVEDSTAGRVTTLRLGIASR